MGVGQIHIKASDVMPNGVNVLPCDGSEIDRTVYAALFNDIGTTWGVGDGSTTFNIPDFRGRGLICDGSGAGLTTRTIGDMLGEETHILSTTEMPTHNHTIKCLNTNANSSSAEGRYPAKFNGLLASVYNNTANDTMASDMVNTSGAGDAHNNMHPVAVVSFWIEY